MYFFTVKISIFKCVNLLGNFYIPLGGITIKKELFAPVIFVIENPKERGLFTAQNRSFSNIKKLF